MARHLASPARCFTLLLLLTLLGSRSHSEDYRHEIRVVGGYGPQVKKDFRHQYNSLFGLEYSGKTVTFETFPNLELDLGFAYAFLHTNSGTNTSLQVFSFFPQWRYQLRPRQAFRPYLLVAIAPSWMNHNSLGQQVQGSQFIFHDVFGFGARFGDTDQWSLSFAWRHLSNGDLATPNPGIDVPFTVSLGRRF